MAEKIDKPVPEADSTSEPFFKGGLEGKLMLMRCNNCRIVRLPSRQHCDACLSDAYKWIEASGRGRIRTFGIMHHKYHAGFETPYNLAVVELEEGPRITTNIVGTANPDIRVDMPVQVEWEMHDAVALPKFRPV